jgi:hypothetical protein
MGTALEQLCQPLARFGAQVLAMNTVQFPLWRNVGFHKQTFALFHQFGTGAPVPRFKPRCLRSLEDEDRAVR